MKIPIISRLFQSRDGPKNSLWSNTYSFLFEPTTSGKTVNEKTAMQTTAVYACVRILAETIASLPLHTYIHTDKGKEKAINHPIYHLLHDAPNPGGVLEHPGIVKDSARVRDSWNSVYQGSSNAHRVAVLEEGMKFKSSRIFTRIR